jgi:TatD DNase family protein
MIPIDIHTHHTPATPGTAIENLRNETFGNLRNETFAPRAGAYYSAGIHPWDAHEVALTEALQAMLAHPQVIAVGEAGLDKHAVAPLTQQAALFAQQARLAARLNKPLIIHLVKATDLLLAVKQALQPRSAWIIHGFRGKPQLAQLYLRHGFYLSFGEHYHPETLRTMPLERLLMETDESLVPIDELYCRAAAVRRISTQALREAVTDTVRQLFFQGKRL